MGQPGPLTQGLRHVLLRDGRRLEYRETGAPGGLPVLALHGLPGGCLGLPAAPPDAGVRLISPGRPGYGGSDPLPGRLIAQFADDLAQLADALAVDRFAVLGYSMGGPFALACSCLLPERVAAVALVAPAGPPPRTLTAARQRGISGPVSRPDTAAARRPVRRLQPRAGGRLQALPGPDRLAYWRAVAGNAFQQGMAGLVGDLLAFRRNWGFDLSSLRAPVLIYHGETDLVVPVAVTRQYARHIVGAATCYYPGEGHRALWPHLPEILADISEICRANRS